LDILGHNWDFIDHISLHLTILVMVSHVWPNMIYFVRIPNLPKLRPRYLLARFSLSHCSIYKCPLCRFHDIKTHFLLLYNPRLFSSWTFAIFCFAWTLISPWSSWNAEIHTSTCAFNSSLSNYDSRLLPSTQATHGLEWTIMIKNIKYI
jgi:hypothetical protein